MTRGLVVATLAALAAGFTRPALPPTRAVSTRATEDEDDLAFLGKAMRAKSKKDDAPFSFDPLAALKNFGQGLDDFMDDAMDRKLGNGAEFYGKRKSNFYGADDEMKTDGKGGDQYSGPVGGGYFRRDKEGRPISKKGKPLK